jgi:hypothetical protein
MANNVLAETARKNAAVYDFERLLEGRIRKEFSFNNDSEGISRCFGPLF